MPPLADILKRLSEEGLLQPASAATPNPPALRGDLVGSRATADAYDSDPRWARLALEYFIEHNGDDGGDDMLFFVRDTGRGAPPRPNLPEGRSTPVASSPDPAQAPAELAETETESVFVRRKTSGRHAISGLADIVYWKATFFLNVICQLPCQLTVAVCRKEAADEAEPTRPDMICTSRRVSRQVYALPSRSKVSGDTSARTAVGSSPGGAGWECSFPLVYFTVNDFDDVFEDVVITEAEHLCVELSVAFPTPLTASAVERSRTAADAGRGNADGQFPPRPPPGMTKVALFQGSASYEALYGVYLDKAGGRIARRLRLSNNPTEYVLMRGPGGKGHAQVQLFRLLPACIHNRAARPLLPAHVFLPAGDVNLAASPNADR